jgi:hypothetical protein
MIKSETSTNGAIKTPSGAPMSSPPTSSEPSGTTSNSDGVKELFERGKAGDREAQFDYLLRRTLEIQNEHTPTKPGYHSLRLQSPPKATLFPALVRSMALVPCELVQVFRLLVTGKAAWPLYLFGPAGTGKTHAALCLADWCDHKTKYWSVEGLVDEYVKGVRPYERFNDPFDFHGVIKGVPKPPDQTELCILDELGERSNITDLQHTTVKRFADYMEMENDRVAVYISNLKPSELAKLYDDRICSRVLCGTRFELKGKDRRIAG